MPKQIQEIKDKKKIIAIIYYNTLKVDGVRFPTPRSYSLQIGIHNQKKDRFVPAHYHPHLKYNITKTLEFIYVVKGRIDIELFNRKWKKIKKVMLKKGDSVLFTDSGHSVKIYKHTRLIEVKQGPFSGNKNNKVFRDK